MSLGWCWSRPRADGFAVRGGGLDAIERQADDPAGVREDLPSGTVTFLFTDVEGSTRLLDRLGADAYAEALATHRRIIREACAAEGGVEVDTQGDAFFFAFPDGRRCACRCRGIHAGAGHRFDPGAGWGCTRARRSSTEEGYVGADVHRASRVAGAGHGGQILVSASTASLISGEGLVDLGEHRFKDLGACAGAGLSVWCRRPSGAEESLSHQPADSGYAVSR